MKSSGKRFKILIVDDHPAVRLGIAALLSRQPDLEVCGEAENADECIVAVARLQPDLVILDMSLSSGTGLDVIRRLRPASESHSRPGVRILVNSMYEDSVYADRVLQAGAMGYINKSEDPDLLLAAIRRVLSGKIYVSQEMTDRMIGRAAGQTREHTIDPVDRLTDRELQIFRMIGEAEPTGRIAKKLFLSVNTVESHRANIKKKLAVKTAAELNQRAVQWVLEKG